VCEQIHWLQKKQRNSITKVEFFSSFFSSLTVVCVAVVICNDFKCLLSSSLFNGFCFQCTNTSFFLLEAFINFLFKYEIKLFVSHFGERTKNLENFVILKFSSDVLLCWGPTLLENLKNSDSLPLKRKQFPVQQMKSLQKLSEKNFWRDE
jgi:hypothetical protein